MSLPDHMGLFDRLRRMFGGDGSSDTIDAAGNGDGTQVDATEDGPTTAGGGDLSIPTVDLAADADLDGAHERTVAAFDEAGYHVTSGSLMNSVGGPLDGLAKLFNFHDDTGMYTGIVYTGEWDDEVIRGVVSMASTIRPDPAAGVFVVSARDPPTVVEYVTGTHPRTAFALDAIVELSTGPPLEADAAPEYADLGRQLLEEHFGTTIDPTDIGSLETLDDMVLSELRPVSDRTAAYEAYLPEEALVLVGTLAGEIMRHGLERDHDAETAWIDGASTSSTGLALAVTGDDGEMTVNPVGKAFKLFRAGSEDSLAFMYRTTVGVLDDEL